jgi:hypothetical protein
MTVWIAINAGEWGTIRDMQVFYSHGAAKSYVRSKANKHDYEIVSRVVTEA